MLLPRTTETSYSRTHRPWCVSNRDVITQTNHIDFTDSNNNSVSLTRIKATSTSNSAPETVLREMLQNQNNITTIYNNGKLQADLKNYTGAQSLYQRALNIDPHNVKVLSDMGRVLYNLKNYSGAIQSVDKALSINSSSVYALEWKEFVLYHLGDYKQALATMDRALELNPSDYHELDIEGIDLMALGDYKQAIRTFNAALSALKTRIEKIIQSLVQQQQQGQQEHAESPASIRDGVMYG